MSMTKINLERALIQLPPAHVLLVRRRFRRIKNSTRDSPRDQTQAEERRKQRIVVDNDGVRTVVASKIWPDPQLSGCARRRVSKCYEIVLIGDYADE